MLAMLAVAYSSSMVMISAFSGYVPAYAAAGASLQNLGADLLAAGGAVLLLIGSYGLWTLQRWAYWLAFAGAGLGVLVHVLPGFQGVTNGTSSISALIAAAMLVYLLVPSVRRDFFEAPANVPA